MKVAILTIVRFPEGMASTNRVLYYAKGLIDNNVGSEVIVIKPTEIKGHVKNPEHIGTYNGVPFRYITGSTIRSSNFLLRRYYDFIGPVKGALYVIRNKFDAIILSSNSFAHPMFYRIIFKMFRIKFIVERSESMFHNKKTKGIHSIKKWILEKIAYRNIDALFAISLYLQKSYRSVVTDKTPVHHIPIIVDENDIYDPEIKRTTNLVYTGPLVQKKDGILTIIESFCKIADDFPETNLIMTGNLERTPEKDKIMKLIDNNPHKKRMVFKGFVTRAEMIELLNSAAGLLLAKPTSDQSDSCFPTKLGEYLTSSNPTVITNTGEIPLYLKDGISAYIAEPDSVGSFSGKLRELLSDPKKARKIGEEGRKVAIENFNYSTIARKIIKIIKDFK